MWGHVFNFFFFFKKDTAYGVQDGPGGWGIGKRAGPCFLKLCQTPPLIPQTAVPRTGGGGNPPPRTGVGLLNKFDAADE